MRGDSHERLVYRLSNILLKLNQGERLSPKALAEEFGVNLRTIQRDLNVRFGYLPLIKTDGSYSLDSTFLGKLSIKDIERFAGLAGVNGLFPSLSENFLREIFDHRVQVAFMVKGHSYENTSEKILLFRDLERAILNRNKVNFDYQKGNLIKSYNTVSPYKLVNQKGIWYLIAQDEDLLKSFTFSKIMSCNLLDAKFEENADVEAKLQDDNGIWFNENPIEFKIRVSPAVADYFRRRKLIANQVIDEDWGERGLIVSARVSHSNQVLPIVKYWIPHLHIISPDGYQDDVNLELLEYVKLQSTLS